MNKYRFQLTGFVDKIAVVSRKYFCLMLLKLIANVHSCGLVLGLLLAVGQGLLRVKFLLFCGQL